MDLDPPVRLSSFCRTSSFTSIALKRISPHWRMDKPNSPRRTWSRRPPRRAFIPPPSPPPAPEEPIEIERCGRRWRFTVTDLGAAGPPRWMWQGPDGPVDARAFQPTDLRTAVVEALHFWVHDWSFFRVTRRVELEGTEWTVRRSSRVAMRGRAPLDEPVLDPSGIYFRAAGGETLFLPYEIAGPDFATLPRPELVVLLQRALGR